MKKAEFISKVENLTSQIEDLIHKMPYKGDSESESQKICLVNSLNQFSFTVNGLKKSDFNK